MSRRSQAAIAYDEVKRRILDNEMPAGFQALESELAQLLGMSRTPVREALVRLADEGLVEVRPRHGMRVLPVSAADMREIYQILTALEAAAAASLAERGLTGEEAAALHRTLADMDTALVRDDLAAWARADRAFHWLLVDLGGNARLKAMVAACLDQSHRVRMLTLKLRPKPLASNRDHADLVAAIEAHDPERARDIHHRHRGEAGRMLVGLREDYGLTQL